MHSGLEINIRKGFPNDRETIAGFQEAMAKETEDISLNRETLLKGVDAVLNAPDKGMYFIAEAEGKVVASLMITYEWSDWRNATVWWLQSVYVLPAFRRAGIFKKMYAHIQAEADKRNDVSGIRLYVADSNLTAAKTYKNVGMDGDRYRMFEWMKTY